MENNKYNIDVKQLIETNRRLNRRCQEAEKEANVLRNALGKYLKELRTQVRCMSNLNSYTREIYKHHKTLNVYYYQCRFCKFKAWLKVKLWNNLFTIKAKNKNEYILRR